MLPRKPQFMVKALILDLDDTLIDSHDAHVKSYEEVFNEMGLSINRVLLEREFGKISEDIIKTLIPGLPKLGIKRAVLAKRKLFLKHLDLVKPERCADEFLKNASRKYFLAIATSTSRRELLAVLKLFGWRDYFKVLLTSYEVLRPKPSPDLLLRTAELLGVSVSDCIFIGDSIFDALSARNAGMPFIGVETGSFSNEDFSRLGFKSFPNFCLLMKELLA